MQLKLHEFFPPPPSCSVTIMLKPDTSTQDIFILWFSVLLLSGKPRTGWNSTRLSPQSRLEIMKFRNIRVGWDHQRSSAPGGVQDNIKSLEQGEEELDFSCLPWDWDLQPVFQAGKLWQAPKHFPLVLVWFLLTMTCGEHREFLLLPGGCGWSPELSRNSWIPG